MDTDASLFWTSLVAPLDTSSDCDPRKGGPSDRPMTMVSKINFADRPIKIFVLIPYLIPSANSSYEPFSLSDRRTHVDLASQQAVFVKLSFQIAFVSERIRPVSKVP